MNIALNLLPTKPVTPQASSSKSSVSSSSSKSQAKTSFSDTLNKAVAKSDEAAANEQEQASTEKPTDTVTTNDGGKKNVTPATQEQTATDTKDTSAADTTAQTEESNTPAQPVLADIINSAVVAQIPLVMPGVAVANANTQPVVAEQQASSGSVTTAIVPETTSKVQADMIAALINDTTAGNQSNQSSQSQIPISNLQQTGQEAPDMLTKLSGTVNEVVAGSNTNAGEQQVTPVQNVSVQPANPETVPNLNNTLLSQLNDSVQKQAVSAGTVQTLTNATVSQQAVTPQNQTVKVEATSTLTTTQEQQPAEPVVIPVIETNQQAGNLSANANNQGQQESLTDAGTLKTAQDIPNSGAEITHTTGFSQTLDAALLTAGNNVTPSVQTAEFQAQASTKADVYQVVDQIVEQTKIITKVQNTEMVMKLKPEHLGELTLKVAVKNGVVNASFHSNNPEVRSLIEASLPQLKQELASTGLKVDNVSVYAGLGQFQPNQDQDRNSQQQLKKFADKKSVGDFIDAVEAIDGDLSGSNLPGIGSQTGVDYRI